MQYGEKNTNGHSLSQKMVYVGIAESKYLRCMMVHKALQDAHTVTGLMLIKETKQHMKSKNSCVPLTDKERRDLLKVTKMETIQDALQEAVEFTILHKNDPQPE